MYIIFYLVSFGACIAGAICGIGGGVIIKPVLDAFGVLSVSAISFLSGCTVLAMSCYSVSKGLLKHDSKIDMRLGTPLAIGAAVGGLIGKDTFQMIASMFSDANKVGAVQAACLAVITLGTLVYTIKKDSIHTHNTQNIVACVVIGAVLGFFSSFLGIGGGPINLVVLYYFFSMTTKTAAQNSLYIILFSQAASFLRTVLGGSTPKTSIVLLVGMVICGILGGMAGRAINKKIDEKAVDKLFIILMAVIILINIYNVYKYMMV